MSAPSGTPHRVPAWMERLALVQLVFATFAIAAGMGLAVLVPELVRDRRENRELEAELDELRGSLEELGGAHRALKRAADELTTERSQLKAEIAELRQKLEQVRARPRPCAEVDGSSAVEPIRGQVGLVSQGPWLFHRDVSVH